MCWSFLNVKPHLILAWSMSEVSSLCHNSNSYRVHMTGCNTFLIEKLTILYSHRIHSLSAIFNICQNRVDTKASIELDIRWNHKDSIWLELWLACIQLYLTLSGRFVFSFPHSHTKACFQPEESGQPGPPRLKGVMSQKEGPACFKARLSHQSIGLNISSPLATTFPHMLSPIYCDGKLFAQSQCALLSAEWQWSPDLMSRSMMKSFFQLFFLLILNDQQCGGGAGKVLLCTTCGWVQMSGVGYLRCNEWLQFQHRPECQLYWLMLCLLISVLIKSDIDAIIVSLPVSCIIESLYHFCFHA